MKKEDGYIKLSAFKNSKDSPDLYHYTDEKGAMAIGESGMIKQMMEEEFLLQKSQLAFRIQIMRF